MAKGTASTSYEIGLCVIAKGTTSMLYKLCPVICQQMGLSCQTIPMVAVNLAKSVTIFHIVRVIGCLRTADAGSMTHHPTY